MALSQLTISIPPVTKERLFLFCESRGMSVSEYVGKCIGSLRLDPAIAPVTKASSRSFETKIPRSIVRQMVQERSQDPPITYRALALKYGYALRTVHRACTGKGGYRSKVLRAKSGRRQLLTEEQRSQMREDYKTMTLAQLSHKYQVSSRTVLRRVK
jgi:hypothetical protein